MNPSGSVIVKALSAMGWSSLCIPALSTECKAKQLPVSETILDVHLSIYPTIKWNSGPFVNILSE